MQVYACHKTVLVSERPLWPWNICGCALADPLHVHAWPGTLLVKDGTHAAHERFFETACGLSPEERSGLKDWCVPIVLPGWMAVSWACIQLIGPTCSPSIYHIFAHRIPNIKSDPCFLIDTTLIVQVPVPAGGAAILGGVPQHGAGRARRLGVPLGQPHSALSARALHLVVPWLGLTCSSPTLTAHDIPSALAFHICMKYSARSPVAGSIRAALERESA